jgi:TANK-binding kinase 1
MYFLIAFRAFRLPSFTHRTPDLDLVVMFDRGDNNVRCSSVTASASRLPKFPSFPSVISVENDATVAKAVCSVGHAIKRVVEDVREAHARSFEAVGWFGDVVTYRTKELKGKCDDAVRLAVR